MSEPNKNDDTFYMGRMRPPPEPERTMPRGLLTVIAIFAFAGIVWYAYPQGAEKYTDIDVPVVTADGAPYKFKPDDPGGMEVRHRDSTVFDTLEKGGAGKAEKLMPKEEEPLDKSKLGLDKETPKLNLEPQMTEGAKTAGKTPAAENIAPKEEAKKEPAKTETPAKAEVKKEPVKQETAKTEEPKTEEVKPAASGSGVYIQLGAYRDAGGAKADWAALQKKHPQLKGLSMRTQKADLGAKGTLYRLQAAVKTEAKAKDICAAMKAKGAPCIVVK